MILERYIAYLNHYIDSENLPYSEYCFKDLTIVQQEEVLKKKKKKNVNISSK